MKRSAERFFTDGQMKTLLAGLRRRVASGRLLDRIDHALVTFCWATGCRASEVASISMNRDQPNWIDLQSGLITITDAKWDSRGVIPLDAASLRIIRRYARDVRPQIRNSTALDRLFLTKTGQPYTPNKLTQKMGMLLSRYGFDSKSAHSFRHFFATDLFRRGGKLHEVKALLRHRDVRSTMVYSHATVDDLRAVVNRRLA